MLSAKLVRQVTIILNHIWQEDGGGLPVVQPLLPCTEFPRQSISSFNYLSLLNRLFPSIGGMNTPKTNPSRMIVVERKWGFVAVDSRTAQQNAATRKHVKVGAMQRGGGKNGGVSKRENGCIHELKRTLHPIRSFLGRLRAPLGPFQPSAEVSFR